LAAKPQTGFLRLRADAWPAPGALVALLVTLGAPDLVALIGQFIVTINGMVAAPCETRCCLSRLSWRRRPGAPVVAAGVLARRWCMAGLVGDLMADLGAVSGRPEVLLVSGGGGPSNLTKTTAICPK
jgi:hypothetical protein